MSGYDNQPFFSKKSKNNSMEKLWPAVQAAEVLDIILDSNHPRYTDVNDIGKIKYRAINSDYGKPLDSDDDGGGAWAKPLELAFKQLPLIHETVILIKSMNSKTGETPGGTSYSYLPMSAAPHANLNYNPVPGAGSQKGSNAEVNQGKDFTGNKSKSDTERQDLKWGEYFEEKPSIERLRPFEGDSIIESRWGTSIRMGSTINDSDIKNGGTKTTWSARGDNGDPILIIRNGTSEESESTEAYIENVDNEKTSIWLTSTQLVNITLSSKRFGTYGISPQRTNGWPSDYIPTLTPEYEGRQAIINSGRIILNAGDDSIFMSSKNSIGIMSEGSIHIDSKKPVVIEGESVRIGMGARQPALLGQSTVDFLRELLIYLQSLDIATTVGPGLCGPGGNTNFNTLLNKLEELKCSVAKVE